MWSLSAWKERLTSLRERWTAIWSNVRARPLVAFGGMCTALLAAVVLYRYWPEIHDWADRAEVGQIIVNSPTVYTRQRLVNDRLAQSQWLQEQLKQAEKEFRSVAQVRNSVLDRAMTIGGAYPNQQPARAGQECGGDQASPAFGPP
jgi:hypothetical protein